MSNFDIDTTEIAAARRNEGGDRDRYASRADSFEHGAVIAGLFDDPEKLSREG